MVSIDRKFLPFVVLVLVAALGVFHSYAKQLPEDSSGTRSLADYLRDTALMQNTVAPDFTLTTIDGDKYQLADHIGKEVVVLNFFATWCAPCKDEMPELNRFYERHKTERLSMLAIVGGEKKEKEALDTFMKEVPVRFPVAVDADGTLERVYRVTGFPRTLLIGANGRITIYDIGGIRNADVSLEPVFKEQLARVNSGGGTTREKFLDAQKTDVAPRLKMLQDRPGEEPILTGRAKVIAESMDCPCGCEHKAAQCPCKRGKGVRRKLATMDIAQKTDEEVIKALNREFCVGKQPSDD